MSVKLTSFGQFTRKLRVDNNEYLKDMAKRLGVTSTYLSAVERGRRNARYDWVELIQEEYGLSDEDTEELRRAVSDSRVYDKLDIAHLSFEDKQLINGLVQQLPAYTKEQREMLQDMVTEDTP